VKLYRYQGPLGGRPRLLCGLAREDFNDVFIQERFGGGEYFGRWRNRKGLYTKFNFDIEGPPKVSEEPERVGAIQPNDEGGAPYPYLQKPEPAQAPEQGAERIGMIDVLRMMAETRREAREEMRGIIELLRPAAAPPNATEQVFSLVKELLPMINGGGGESGTGNALIDGFIKLKDPIMKALETAQLALKREPQPAPMPPQPAQRPPQAVIPPTSPVGHVTPGATVEPQQPITVNAPTEGDMLADSFKEYIPMLVKAADAGKDPGLYCDLILDQVPRFVYHRVRAWLVKPGCLDDLAKHAPIISESLQQREWWEALRRMLIDSLNEEIGDAPGSVQPQPHSDPSTSGSTDSA
jgi:hypothetical protein